ncbi:MAG: HD domain-containing phosphohydrolase [Candidatus Zixiibacteriota bacterium]
MPVIAASRVVVVDDEESICTIVQEMLSSEKYEVVSFTDAGEALDHIKNHRVDLVLTDQMMGEYSGMQVLEATLASHSDAVVLLMTAHPTVQTALSVLRKGAYDFLVKPFKLELLRATVKRGLEHQKVLRENVQLKGQVEFLKAASTAQSNAEIENYISLILRSCRQELSASAAAFIEVDGPSKRASRIVYESDSDDARNQVIDEATLERFAQSKSSKPVVTNEEITCDKEAITRTFIVQPVHIRRRLCGVINLLIERRFDEVTPGKLELLKIMSNAAASAVANYRLNESVGSSYLQAIRALANAIEARDKYTAGHTDRVCRLAELMASQLGWDRPAKEHLIMGCTLHDIGKIGVPDAILNKASRLSEEEIKQMSCHPQVGLKIIAGINLFKPAIPYIGCHHERFDGAGYPKGLKGENIPIEGRLLAVADTFDAIMSDRPYRAGRDLETAVKELLHHSGSQFDPMLVDTLLTVIRAGKIDFKKQYGRSEDVSVIDSLRLSETATERVSV